MYTYRRLNLLALIVLVGFNLYQARELSIRNEMLERIFQLINNQE